MVNVITTFTVDFDHAFLPEVSSRTFVETVANQGPTVVASVTNQGLGRGAVCRVLFIIVQRYNKRIYIAI